MKTTTGYVYFIMANGRIKIGRSKNPEQRFRTFRTTIPEMKVLRVVKTNDMYKLERRYHKRFERFRIIKEWYSITIYPFIWF